MKVSVQDRGRNSLRERLRERLDRAAALRCAEHDQPVVAVTIHDQPVVAVTIHDRENGWFDAQWTTCCEHLERQAVAIVKQRC